MQWWYNAGAIVVNRDVESEGWWREPGAELATLESSDRGVTTIAGREYEPGKWEYAVVWWFYRAPHLRCHMRDGAATTFE